MNIKLKGTTGDTKLTHRITVFPLEKYFSHNIGGILCISIKRFRRSELYNYY